MNKTILATLVAIPLAFFAADKAMGLNHPGGDDKKTSSPTTPGGGEAQAGDSDAPMLIRLEDLDEKEMVKLTKDVAANKKHLQTEAAFQAFRSSSTLGLWNSSVDTSDAAFITDEVVHAMREMDPVGVHLVKSFSRCGSGYKASLLADENLQPTQEGYMIAHQGCKNVPVGKFQAHFASRTIGVQLPGYDRLVPVRTYLMMYKLA